MIKEEYNTLIEQLGRMRTLTESVAPVMQEARGLKLDAKIKRLINKDLQATIGAITYFSEFPLDKIFAILKNHGVVPLQEDNTEWSGILLGDDSHTYITLGLKNTEHPVNGIPTYEPVDNASLTLSWHRMPSNKWEILAFIG